MVWVEVGNKGVKLKITIGKKPFGKYNIYNHNPYP